jgi:hypothetical protein
MAEPLAQLAAALGPVHRGFGGDPAALGGNAREQLDDRVEVAGTRAAHHHVRAGRVAARAARRRAARAAPARLTAAA